MTRPRLEVADIFRRHGAAFRAQCGDSLTALQQRVMSAIEQCRTAALGGQIEQCDRCGHRRRCYRSCRNRHCPKCQGPDRAAWLAKHRGELLDCPYFHVVFTLPAEIAALALQNRLALYNLLFRAADRTLREIAADPRHLGAEIGFLAVLHTWGSSLGYHPHLHCVVPGGGLAPSGDRWIACRPRFFLPVRVLSRRFRTLFLDQLEQAFRQGRLRLGGGLAALADPAAFARYLRPLRRREWVVYSKAPFDGPARVLDYLGRYTHRVAISNERLLSLDGGRVRFRFKDYRQPHRLKTMTLPASEFIRRFLLHLLPPGFHRIRHFGFLANCHRRRKAGAVPPPALHAGAGARSGAARRLPRPLRGPDRRVAAPLPGLRPRGDGRRRGHRARRRAPGTGGHLVSATRPQCLERPPRLPAVPGGESGSELQCPVVVRDDRTGRSSKRQHPSPPEQSP